MIRLYEYESSVVSQFDSAQDQYDKADSSLVKYVLNPLYKLDVTTYWDTLVSRYGLLKSIKLYRGVNFKTKESYEQFMSELSDGKLNTQSFTSWSPSRSCASQFATTRPNYLEFMSEDTQRLIASQKKSGERVTGYRGVILETIGSPGVDLDVRRFKGSKEPEVLVAPRSIMITKVTEELSYRDTFQGKSPDEIVLSLSSSKLARSRKDAGDLLLYLVNNVSPNDLSDEARRYLFNLTAPRAVKFAIKVYDPSGSLLGRKVLFTNGSIITSLLPYYPVGAIETRMRRYRNDLLTNVVEFYRDYDPSRYEYKISFDLPYYSDLMGISSQVNNIRKKSIGQQYHKINSKSSIDHINSLSGDDQKEAISNQIDELMRILRSI